MREQGKYFYATKSALNELFNRNEWSGQTMEVVSEGKLGSWTGSIMAWDKGADSHGRRDPSDLSAVGQWSPGDKIKSKACTIGNYIIYNIEYPTDVLMDTKCLICNFCNFCNIIFSRY